MKNKIKYLICLATMMLVPVSVFAADVTYSYRGKEKNVIYIIGVALLIIRIMVPILLIVVGMIGLVKAMTQNSDADIKKELKKLVPKVIAVIIIFMLPSIIALLLGIMRKDSLWDEYSKCLTRPAKCNVDFDWE